MMSRPPFRHIAILSPEHVFGRSHRPNFAETDGVELDSWLNRARKNGADAVYARIYRELPNFAYGLLQRLSRENGLALIAPVALSEMEFRPAAWHSRASDPPVAVSPGGSLRGRSCHHRADVEKAQAEGLDYVFLSPVFSTRTHPDAVPLGLEKLRDTCRRVDIPVFALGGIDAGRINLCREAGAYGVAGIRIFLS